MFVYLSVILVVPVLYAILIKNEHRDKVVLIVTCSVMFLLLSMRSRYSGVDLVVYEGIFNTIKEASFSEIIGSISLFGICDLVGLEAGYSMLNWIIAKLHLDFQFLLIIQSAFCVFSAYRFIDRNSLNLPLSIALLIGFGFVDYTYCIVRQALSLAIFFYAFDAIKNRRPIVFVSLVIAAILMHRSAISFVVVYPLSYLPIKRKTVAIYCLLCASLVLVFPFASKYILARVVEIIGYGSGYLDINFEIKEMLFAVLLIAAFIVVFMDQETEFNERDRTAFWAFMIMVPLEFIGLYSPIFSRLSTLTFLPFASVAIVNTLETNKNKKLVNMLEFLILLAAIMYYFLCLYLDKRLLNLIPYRSFIQDFGV